MTAELSNPSAEQQLCHELCTPAEPSPKIQAGLRDLSYQGTDEEPRTALPGLLPSSGKKSAEKQQLLAPS